MRTSGPRCRAQGVTLIELLIVLAILGTLVALVAPFAQKQVERTRAEEEWLVLQRTASGIVFAAFMESAPVTVDAEGRRLQWTVAGREPRMVDFEQLYFERQRINVNANGLADTAVLRVRQRERQRSVALNRGFDVAP